MSSLTLASHITTPAVVLITSCFMIARTSMAYPVVVVPGLTVPVAVTAADVEVTVGTSLVVAIAVPVAAPAFVGPGLSGLVAVPADTAKLVVEVDVPAVVVLFLVGTNPVAEVDSSVAAAVSVAPPDFVHQLQYH